MMNKMWKRTSQAPRCQTHQINNPVLNACTLGLCLRHTSARSRAFSSRRARGRGHFGLGWLRSADRLFTAADRLSAAPSGSRRHQEPVCAYIRAYSVRITGFWQAVRRTVLPHHRGVDVYLPIKNLSVLTGISQVARWALPGPWIRHGFLLANAARMKASWRLSDVTWKATPAWRSTGRIRNGL